MGDEPKPGPMKIAGWSLFGLGLLVAIASRTPTMGMLILAAGVFILSAKIPDPADLIARLRTPETWQNPKVLAAGGVVALIAYGALTDTAGVWIVLFLAALFWAAVRFVRYLRDSAPDNTPTIHRSHRRGAAIVSTDEYRQLFSERFPSQARSPAVIAGIPYPVGNERMHTSISASTGAGKTTALRELLASIRARGDRAIVLDNNSEFLRAFRQDDDLVVSPFGTDGPGWRLSNEARALHDWDRLADAFVPQGSASAAEWHGMAKALFGALGAGLSEVQDGTFTNVEFQRLLTSADAEELAPYVAGTTAEVLAGADEHNSRRLQSVRMSFIEHLKAWRHVRDGDFSFRDWIAEDTAQWMFLPYSDYEMKLARDLLAAWVDIIVTSALDRPPDAAPTRTTWIVVDELNSLGEISALLVAATRLRKAGVAIVVAVQDYAQLRETYGDNRAETLMNNFSNKLILRTTEGNAAEYLSKQIGEREMLEESSSVSFGQGGPGRSYSQSIVTERIVMASEIQKLPDLDGFMNFTGDWPVIRVRVPLPKSAQTEKSV